MTGTMIRKPLIQAQATNGPLDLRKLAEPFDPSDIEWRIGRSGKGERGFWATALAYLTNRAIMQRLDDVCGPENWKNEFREWHIGEHHGVLCGISIKTGGEWVTKWDGAENTDIESIKGGLSDSMKRAAVHWGIGRYLYYLDENFVECAAVKTPGFNYAKSKDGVFYWKTPELPAWAIPLKPAAKVKKRSDYQPTVDKVVETLAGCNNPSRLETIYQRAFRWSWTPEQAAEINRCYLGCLARLRTWVLNAHTFHDRNGRPIAQVAQEVGGRITVQQMADATAA